MWKSSKAPDIAVGYWKLTPDHHHPPLPQEIEAGRVWKSTKAPDIAVGYWKLKPDAGMRELVLAVRADEVGGWLGGRGRHALGEE